MELLGVYYRNYLFGESDIFQGTCDELASKVFLYSNNVAHDYDSANSFLTGNITA